MKSKHLLLFVILLAVVAITLVAPLLSGKLAIFHPKGPVAEQERDLIIAAVALMLLIVVPVVSSLYFIAWKYRASNTKAKYAPNRKHGVMSEILMWVFPVVITTALALVAWGPTHKLDPYEPLLRQGSGGQALTIRVVALRWKWLFIYPEQNIATVNFIQFPVDTPLRFELTADAPMSSFWIPELGSQIYAMTGMTTQLHLMADEPGDFPGRATEVNGSGYAGMEFIARASAQEDFDAWVSSVKASDNALTMAEYHRLAEPSENVAPAYYASAFSRLYDDIIEQFMSPDGTMPDMEGMDM